MSDKIKKSEELRGKISESVGKIQEIGFLKKMANKVFGKDSDEVESNEESSENVSNSPMVYDGGDSWTLNGNKIDTLIIYKPGVDPKSTLEDYDWKNGAMSWLAKGRFHAKYITINLETEVVDVFVGEWNGGAFRGNIFTDHGVGRVQAKEGDSHFNAGTFNGKILRINYTTWRTNPIGFAGRKIDHTDDGLLGLPNITKTTDVDHNGIHLIQVPNGYTIQFKTEDDQHINAIRIIKRMNNTNTDFVFEDVNSGNKINVDWNTIRKNFNKFYLKPGKVFSIPGMFETKEPIGSIEVKKSSAVSKRSIGQDYQKQPGGGLTKISFGKKFPVLGKQGLKGEFNILNFNKILAKDPDALHFIKMFQQDLKGGGKIFSNHVEKVKNAIVNRDKYKREVGYGKYPHLKKLTDKQGSKITDKELDTSLKYISDFIENIVDNIGKFNKSKKFSKDEKAQGVLLNAMKKALNIIKDKPTKEDPSKKAPSRGTIKNIKKKLKLREMIRDIMQEEDDETFFGK